MRPFPPRAEPEEGLAEPHVTDVVLLEREVGPEIESDDTVIEDVRQVGQDGYDREQRERDDLHPFGLTKASRVLPHLRLRF
jgi:hypothetical protein